MTEIQHLQSRVELLEATVFSLIAVFERRFYFSNDYSEVSTEASRIQRGFAAGRKLDNIMSSFTKEN